MNKKISLISMFAMIISFSILFFGTKILTLYDLQFRSWIRVVLWIITILSIFILEYRLYRRIYDFLKNSSSKIADFFNVILVLAYFWLILITLLFSYIVIGLSMDEIDIVTINEEKYIVKETSFFEIVKEYYPHINIFVNSRDYRTFENDKEIDNNIKKNKESNDLSNYIDNKVDDEMEERDLIIEEDNIYFKDSIENMEIGFHLKNHAINSYEYSFVKKEDTWKEIFKFPVTNDLYYGKFITDDIGFVNFSSENELIIFITKDSGDTWEKLELNIPIKYNGLNFIKDIKIIDEDIILTLSLPNWVKTDKEIVYISKDNGQKWIMNK